MVQTIVYEVKALLGVEEDSPPVKITEVIHNPQANTLTITFESEENNEDNNG
tara:strand:+ start:690 stop:845 length:156 start_codon:yes stop_codon:yes gene_type:complete